MAVSTLRTVGGSVMMAIPKPLLETLGLMANAKLDVVIEDGKIVATPQSRPRYTLEELVAQCDPEAPLSVEDHDWLQDAPKGGEII